MKDKKRQKESTEQLVEDTNDARQGVELHEMRYFVVFGTIGALVILGAIWYFYYVT